MTTHLYDARDWLWRTLNPLQQATTFTNDAAGRLVSVTDPLWRASQFAYDADNRKIYTANAAGEATWDFWDQRSKLIFTITPQSTYIDHVYDGAGNQTALTSRDSKVWRFQYDTANRLIATISPAGRTNAQTWNNRGLLASVKEPSGQTATLSYDAKGRLTNRTDSVGTVTYRHDANNKVTNIIEGGKTNAWMFDAYGRVQTYRDGDGIDLVCQADGRLRLAVNQWPDGIRNDSSPGKLVVGKWTFFAVTYDASRSADNVSWYFSPPLDAPGPAEVELDCTTSYNHGAVGTDLRGLAIGNFNETMHDYGLDRQFRGEIRGLQIFGSRLGSRGALSLDLIQRHTQ